MPVPVQTTAVEPGNELVAQVAAQVPLVPPQQASVLLGSQLLVALVK